MALARTVGKDSVALVLVGAFVAALALNACVCSERFGERHRPAGRLALRRSDQLVERGGYDVANDTWAWDGATWTQLAPIVSPPGRHEHAMAYDANRGVVTLFGGLDWEGLFAETWEFDGASWTQVDTQSLPPTRGDIAYDSARGVVVLRPWTHAADVFPETWEYDGANWTAISTTNTAPAGSMAYDAARGVVVLLADDIWEYAGPESL